MNASDLNQTSELRELFLVPENKRNEKWLKKFYRCVGYAALMRQSAQPFVGPDGYAYMALQIPKECQDYEYCSIESLLDECLSLGTGLVIGLPSDVEPQWIFSYGDLWNFKRSGKFKLAGTKEAKVRGPIFSKIFKRDFQVTIGAPSPELLPDFARTTLRKLSAGRLKVFVLHASTQDPLLMLNLYPKDFANFGDFATAVERVRWVFPDHYKTCTMDAAHELNRYFSAT